MQTHPTRRAPSLFLGWILFTVFLPSVASTQSDSLAAFNQALEHVVEKVGPAVVQVDATGPAPDEDENSDAISGSGQQKSEHSIGSGVVLDPNGYIVTNAHVVSGAISLTVTLEKNALARSGMPTPNFTTLPAHLVGEFVEADLAVIKVDAVGLPFLSFNLEKALKQGQLVVAMGSPKGLRNSVSVGVVSSTGRQVTADSHTGFIQTDAAINPGNSGGALVDIEGKLVGINADFMTEGGGSEGLGFAIPARLVQFVYETLRKTGRIDWGATGVRVQGITPTLAAGLKLPRDWGVVVSDVFPRTPAYVGGVKAGDLIVNLDGKPLEDLPQYYETMYHKAVGDKVALTILRDSHTVDLEIPVGPGPVESENHRADKSSAFKLVTKLGIYCSELGTRPRVELAAFRSRSGVLVEAKAGGADALANLMTGDVIRSVNLTQIFRVADLQSILDRAKPGTPIVLQVERRSQFLYLPVEAN